MRVQFSGDALNHNASFRWLDRLLYLFEDGWHDWMIPNPDEVKSSSWYQDQGRNKKRIKELFHKSVVKTTRGSGAILKVCPSPSDFTELTAKDAYWYLETPLIILVENAESDGVFIELITNKLSNVLKNKRLQGAWFVEGTGGKDGVVPIIQQKLTRPLIPEVRPRIVVVVDSDRMNGQMTEPKTDRLIDCCRELHVLCHVLQKREIENYIPTDLLKDWNHGLYGDTALALEKLTAEQADYYDMKKGFQGVSNQLTIDPNQKDLYNNVSDEVLQSLHKGFGKHVWQVFRDCTQKATSRLLRTRANNGYYSKNSELDTIVELISQRL